jgi:hypothetical protein
VSEATTVSRREAQTALESLPMVERATIRREALAELSEIVEAQARLAKRIGDKGTTSAARFVAEMAGMLKAGAIPRDIVGEKLTQTKDVFFAALAAEIGEERAGAVWTTLYQRFAAIWGDV